MLEPISNKPLAPKCSIEFGGVSMDKNDVASMKETKSSDNGESIFTVKLKNGVTVTYPQQESGAQLCCANNTGLFEMTGAVITGSDAQDHITLYDCKNSYVDVSGDKQKDKVKIFNRYDEDKDNNVVKQDDKDRTTLEYGIGGPNRYHSTTLSVEGEGELVQREYRFDAKYELEKEIDKKYGEGTFGKLLDYHKAKQEYYLRNKINEYTGGNFYIDYRNVREAEAELVAPDRVPFAPKDI